MVDWGRRWGQWLGLVVAGCALATAAQTQQDLQELCPSFQELAAFDWDNPHIEPHQVATVHRLARQVHRCVEQAVASQRIRSSAAWRRPLLLLEHFTANAGEKSRSQVDFSASHDPAVVFLRDTLQVPVPPGLVFVCRYESLEAMPSFVRAGFQRSATQAVTLGCRYIAIKERWDQWDKNQPSRFDRRIFSHELAHAYVNSGLGLRRHQLPLWFHEAIAAYASGTGNLDHAIDVAPGPGGIQLTHYDNPMDYQTYALVFRYLKHRLGRAALHNCLRDCLTQASVKPLLAAAYIRDYKFLVIDARYWQEQRHRKRFWIALAVLVMMAIWIWRHLPRQALAAEEEAKTED